MTASRSAGGPGNRSEAAATIKPAYLIAGTDIGKIDAALSRLRARAESDGGPGALQAFGAGEAPADTEALVGAIPSLSLIAERRYLVAEGVERWTAKQAAAVIAALAELPPDVTIALVAREVPPRTVAPKAIPDAVKRAGGEVLRYDAPRARDLPARLVGEAASRGFTLDREAARVLVERIGQSTMRLATEIERLAVWAGPAGQVTAGDLEAMVADTSEQATWGLSDAIVTRDSTAAARAAERLASQGEAIGSIVYQVTRRLRDAHRAAVALDAGAPAKEVERELRMHPYAARMLVRAVRATAPHELRAATCAFADLEWWTRGGSDYPDNVALTLAVRRAAGAGRGVEA